MDVLKVVKSQWIYVFDSMSSFRRQAGWGWTCTRSTKGFPSTIEITSNQQKLNYPKSCKRLKCSNFFILQSDIFTETWIRTILWLHFQAPISALWIRSLQVCLIVPPCLAPRWEHHASSLRHRSLHTRQVGFDKPSHPLKDVGQRRNFRLEIKLSAWNCCTFCWTIFLCLQIIVGIL